MRNGFLGLTAKSARFPRLGSRCLPAGLRILEASTKASAFRSTSARSPSQAATPGSVPCLVVSEQFADLAESRAPTEEELFRVSDPLDVHLNLLGQVLACPRPSAPSQSRSCVPSPSRLLESHSAESFS